LVRYLVNTRPDIAHSVGVASRFTEAPSAQHWALINEKDTSVFSCNSNYGCSYEKGVSQKLS